MIKVKYNQFLALAIVATGLMAGIIFSLEWPEGRQLASKTSVENSAQIK